MLVVDARNYIINGSLSATVDPPVAADNGQPWRPLIPESYGTHGHWVLDARHALDSHLTGERGGGRHPAMSSHSSQAASWRLRSVRTLGLRCASRRDRAACRLRASGTPRSDGIHGPDAGAAAHLQQAVLEPSGPAPMLASRRQSPSTATRK